MPSSPEQRAAFGLALRVARTDVGLTQAEVGEAVGKSQPLVREWEAGKKEPSPADACELERILDVDVPGSLTRHLGYLPVWATGERPPCKVEDAVLAEGRLTSSSKLALLGVYRELLEQRR